VLPLIVAEIREYIDIQGRNAYRRWLAQLDVTVRARVIASVLRLEVDNFSAAKGVGSGVFELRMDFGPGFRAYFGKDGEQLVILLPGGTKKRQQADIEMAQALWAEYKKRKREE
jgi:putative addiction module killer protein